MRFASWSFAAVAVLAVAAVASLTLQRRAASGGAPPASPTVAAAADGNAVVRLHEKDAVVQELVGGGLTLREAAGRFRDIDAAFPPVGARRLPGEENQPEAERYCRQVVRWVQAKAADEPGGSAGEAARRAAGELEGGLRSGLVELSELR